jgi:uncharacterized protein (TIGR02453 family)
MLQQSTLHFLKQLNKNNNKPWFDENRKIYEQAKSDFVLFISGLIRTISSFDASLENLEAKKCIFRINRDVRFSKDKSPYKTNFGASLSAGGKKISIAGYYFHCEPGKSFLAGGFYMPEPDQLAKIRQEIDYNYDKWKKIIQDRSFKKFFPDGIEGINILSRPPKGYDESNPAIEFLKMKCFIVSHPLTDKELTDKDLLKKSQQVYKAMWPLINFLNTAID